MHISSGVEVLNCFTSLIHLDYPDLTSYHLQIIILISPFQVALARLRTLLNSNGVFLQFWIKSHSVFWTNLIVSIMFRKHFYFYILKTYTS